MNKQERNNLAQEVKAYYKEQILYPLEQEVVKSLALWESFALVKQEGRKAEFIESLPLSRTSNERFTAVTIAIEKLFNQKRIEIENFVDAEGFEGINCLLRQYKIYRDGVEGENIIPSKLYRLYRYDLEVLQNKKEPVLK